MDTDIPGIYSLVPYLVRVSYVRYILHTWYISNMIHSTAGKLLFIIISYYSWYLLGTMYEVLNKQQ